MSSEMHESPTAPGEPAASFELPAPTGWPIVMALGICMLAAGVVTNLAFSLLGLILAIAGIRGWVLDLRPGRGHVDEPLVEAAYRTQPILPTPHKIEHLRPGMSGHRMQLPEKVHPYRAGVLGGLAGGVAMAAIALTYGAISGRGIWYPINLAAAMAIPGFDLETIAELETFSQTRLLLATFIHLLASLLVGLIYGMLLPMLPNRPVLWGGLIAPLLWTGALHSALGVLNPAMEELVSWPWFVGSQFAFGIVAGLVVVRSEKVYTSQLWRRQPHDATSSSSSHSGSDS